MSNINIANVIIDRQFLNLDDLELSKQTILDCLCDIDKYFMNDSGYSLKKDIEICRKYLDFVTSTFGSNTSMYIRKLSKHNKMSKLLQGLYMKCNDIRTNFNSSDLYYLIDLYVYDLKTTEYSNIMEYRIHIMMNVLCGYITDTIWMTHLIPDTLDYIYNHYRTPIINRLNHLGYIDGIHIVDIEYWNNGGTKLFTFNDVNEILTHLQHTISISNDVIKFKLSHANWIRVKNGIIDTLKSNMNNIDVLYSIVITHNILLSNTDIYNIRECLYNSNIELRDFSSYYDVLLYSDINLTEIYKDINTFLLRGGDISTIHVIDNGYVYITYDMIVSFINTRHVESVLYNVFNDADILDSFIDIMSFLDNSTINKIASIVISNNIFEYPDELVDYLISYTGYSISQITPSSYKVLSYILSKNCDIDEIIVLHDKIKQYPDILEYIPWKLLRYIPDDMLIHAILSSTKFHSNVKIYLDYSNIQIPDTIINKFPGYYSPHMNK